MKVTAYVDRTFSFEVRAPTSSWFLKKAAGLQKGATNPGVDVVGKLSVKHLYELAKARVTRGPALTACLAHPAPPSAQVKQKDPGMEHLSLQAIARSLVGTIAR